MWGGANAPHFSESNGVALLGYSRKKETKDEEVDGKQSNNASASIHVLINPTNVRMYILYSPTHVLVDVVKQSNPQICKLQLFRQYLVQ